MAIIIPSSKIYSLANSKVRNNVIERIEVSANLPSLKYDYDTRVDGGEYDTKEMWTLPSPFDNDILSYYDHKTASHSYWSAGAYYFRALGSGVYCNYKHLDFEIPKLNGSVLIEKIKSGQREGVNNIKTTITYSHWIWNAFPKLKLKAGADTSQTERYDRYEMLSLEATNGFDKGTKTIELLERPTSFSLSGSVENMPILSLSFGADTTNVSTAQIIYNESKDAYEVSLDVLCGLSWFKVAFGNDIVLENGVPIKCGYAYSTAKFPETLEPVGGAFYGDCKGRIEDYKPLQLNVDFYGNTIQLDLKEGTLYINGETAKKVHSVERNELMQTTNYRGEVQSLVEDFSKTQELYAKGKETATVRCSIGDYYDNENGLAITPKTDSKMTFEIGDKVVPMVRNSKGADNALSYHSNGTAKVFNVVGEKYTYDGAVWQELTLRETAEGIYYVDSPPYLTFSSSEEFTLETQGRTHHWNGIIEYSTDLTNWEVWNGETIIPSHRGKLYLRGSGNITITNGGSNSAFKLTGANIDCKGNIETLLDYQTVKRGEHPKMYTRCFYALFLRNDALIGVPSLPSTNLAYGCYDMMFRECINLTELPNLPAKNLPSYCYSSMFLDCSSIKISTTKSNEYNREYRIPIVGDATFDENSLRAMFTLTGGEFKGTPDANTTYYTSNKIV